MTPFLGSIIIDVFLQKSRPNLMGHFFTSIPSISATSINFTEKWRSQKRSNLRVGPKIEKIVKVFVMELIHEFWFSLKTIFQFLHKKITSKFAIFAIVGLAKKVSHDHEYSKMAFSKSVQKRSKSHCLCSKLPFLWVWSCPGPAPNWCYLNQKSWPPSDFAISVVE